MARPAARLAADRTVTGSDQTGSARIVTLRSWLNSR